MKSVTIGGDDAGQRLDKFLTKAYHDLPQAMLYKNTHKKDVKLNGKRYDTSARLNVGGVLIIYLKDEFFQQEPEEYDLPKAPLKLNILSEDENILIPNKKPGLIVHPDGSYHFDPLIARVQHYLYDKGGYRPQGENNFTLALVNWIDRNTGGTVMTTKNAGLLRILNERVKNRELEKLCPCTVCGRTEEKSATLGGLLKKNENQNRVYILSHGTSGAKSIRTCYRALGKRDAYSPLGIDLLTGHTHQVRMHLVSIGRLLVGGGKYSIDYQDKKTGLPYQALYSHELRSELTPPMGILEYLNHREFGAKEIWLLKDFYSWGAQEGKRMQYTIRTWRPSDVTDLTAVMNNPNILKNLRDGIPYPYTWADTEGHIRTALGVEPSNQYVFTIDVNDRVIGSTGVFRQANIHFRTAELGHYAAEPYWGRGICTSAVRQICDCIFQNSDILHIFAEPFAYNATSYWVLEKAGFILEGTPRKSTFGNGEILDMKLYSLTK